MNIRVAETSLCQETVQKPSFVDENALEHSAQAHSAVCLYLSSELQTLATTNSVLKLCSPLTILVEQPQHFSISTYLLVADYQGKSTIICCLKKTCLGDQFSASIRQACVQAKPFTRNSELSLSGIATVFLQLLLCSESLVSIKGLCRTFTQPFRQSGFITFY